MWKPYYYSNDTIIDSSVPCTELYNTWNVDVYYTSVIIYTLVQGMHTMISQFCV